MASATNSSVRNGRCDHPLLSSSELSLRIEAALARAEIVPLLVLRAPEFAQLAWSDGKARARRLERRTVAAFRDAARCIVRAGDALAHDAGSDCFAVAMLTPARAGAAPGSSEVRSSLERIAAAMSLSTGRALETGWWMIEARAQVEPFERTIARALDRGNRERERHELFATVGHELRTPLTSIRGYIETLLDERLEPGTARAFLETARREALRLGRLVDGMFEFSMLDLATCERGARCDLVEQILATVDALAPLARERGIAVSVDLPPAAEARVEADACMHLLVNVLENALKYGRDGGVVRIACSRSEPFVCIAVDDDGPGIAPEQRESIFARGRRGVGAEPPGSGIGLAIVKAVAERAGGDVRAVSSPLGGASLRVRFPAAP